MANKEYYKFWLQTKSILENTIQDDFNIQEIAKKNIGLKPQNLAVETVAKVYCKYCELFNKLCECYDQMTQVQRRPYIRILIDAITCRIIELKNTLEEIESFQYTYPENALQQMMMVPEDINIICPFFCSFEIREQETQYIIDEIMRGNRIGDPPPNPSENELKEVEEERTISEQKQRSKRKITNEEESSHSEPVVLLSTKELEIIKLKEEFERHISNIQRMERSRVVVKEVIQKFNKDTDVYLELAGLKSAAPREDLKLRATILIQTVCRQYMQGKRNKLKENQVREILGMIEPSYIPPSSKINNETIKKIRRAFRQNYYDNYLKENINEKNRIMRLREGDILEDISAEVREWFREWYKSVRLFDEYPWPEEGGSIFIVRGETFTIEEYKKWREEEDKRLKAESSSPKSSDQIKAEKLAAKLEMKRLEAEAMEREKKRIEDYKRLRLNPDNDPGVYINRGQCIEPIEEAWRQYECQWKSLDTKYPQLDVVRGYIRSILTESAYETVQISLRAIADVMMRAELLLLKNALKKDCLRAGVLKPPQSQKRKKPKKDKLPKPDTLTPANIFQELVDAGIIIQYPRVSLIDYWGDKSYAAADMRAIPWNPKFPPACIGDVQEQVRIRMILSLCADCSNAIKSHIIVGPKSHGKKTLIYAIATETNSIIIDLSPSNIYNKYPGPKKFKLLLQLVNKVSRIMQPAIIMIDNVERTFYKKVPKEEKYMDPTRLQKDLFQVIIKTITPNDKILVIGTAVEPWLAKTAPLKKAFSSVILLPRTDYGSISYILSKLLMKYHGVDRDFDLHSLAQVLRGYDIHSIKRCITKVLTAERQASLWHTPLKPQEFLTVMQSLDATTYVSEQDYEHYKTWYISFSPWGEKYEFLKSMLNSQLEYKLKNEKKKKKA